MKALEEYIVKYGQIKSKDILKVDNFLNQLVDIKMLREMAKEWYLHFKDKGVTKVLTIEASGIALATLTASLFDVPVLFAKKGLSSNMSSNLYQAKVFSFTHNNMNNIFVDKNYLLKNDKVLIIDDFLANGQAVMGLLDLCYQAKAKVVGIGISIEKGFQKAGDMLRSTGYDLKSLAIIEEMDPVNKIIKFKG